MTLSELQKRLDEIGWHEQLEHELAERGPSAAPPDLDAIAAQLRALAALVDVPLLNQLEHQEGYLVWMLRLLPLVDAPNATQRARRYRTHGNWHVRQWAERVDASM